VRNPHDFFPVLGRFGDAMELERLLLDLDREFGLDEFSLDKETTIGRIVEAVLERQENT
jgi:hypothetical protein